MRATTLPRPPRRAGRGRCNHHPLATYFSQIGSTPLLTAEEEKDLASRVREGDAAARDHLVCANLRLVVNIARGYVGKGMDLADLIAEGNLGLLRAARGFDPARSTRFSTYASYWIKQSIGRGLINAAKAVRLPAYMAQLMTERRRATAGLQEELGRPPTEEEVAARLNLPRRKLNLLKKAIRVYNATPQADPAEEGQAIDATVMDVRARAPEATLIEADDLREALALLNQMDERPRAVLRLRFGLGGEPPKTLQEIGTVLGLTRERVRQIEREALAGLRDLMDVS